MKEYLKYLKNFNYLQKPVILGVIGMMIVFLGVGAVFMIQNRSQDPKVSGDQTDQKAAQEVKKLVAEVGKLIDLPLGENPTIATVLDITKLKDQPFFQKAKNGDKVLIYTNARKAILYDPQTKKIIDVAPLNIGTQSAAASPSATPR